VLPLAEFISRNILGFRTWIGRQVRYRITDFSVEAALFLVCLSFDLDFGGLTWRTCCRLVAVFLSVIRHFQTQVTGVG
jgi:hypothetical protein